MTWNYFIGFMWVFFCLVALTASLGVALYYLILGVEQVLREEAMRWRKANNTSPPAPLPVGRVEGGTSRRGEGDDDHDIDGGAGPTPVTP